MKRAFLSAGLLCLAVALAPAVAQPPSVGPFGAASAPQPGAGSAPAADDTQEQVEILRRLLDKAFQDAYGHPHKPGAPLATFGTLMDPNRPTLGFTYEGVDFKNLAVESAVSAAHTEGVYLKDYGVVYTATLPLPPFSVVGGTGAAPAGKPAPDDWDRIRKEIHGETPQPGASPVPGHTPLSEVILKVLADNGRHFTGLQDGERITVAVTFRGAATCANCHQNPWGNGQPGAPVFGSDGKPIPRYAVWTDQAASESHPPDGTAPQYVLDARHAILLGDLHMKQGKPQDAIDAYKQAELQLAPVLAHAQQSEPGLGPKDVPALLAGVDVGNKLAAAYVQAGDAEAAGKALKGTAELAKQAEKLTGVAVPVGPSPQPAAHALPSKLVVTASKKQLDDVAAGRLTFEAFCKAATVEYVTPPADKK